MAAAIISINAKAASQLIARSPPPPSCVLPHFPKHDAEMIHSADIVSACFALPFERRLILGTEDGKLLLVNYVTGAILDEMQPHAAEVIFGVRSRVLGRDFAVFKGLKLSLCLGNNPPGRGQGTACGNTFL